MTPRAHKLMQCRVVSLRYDFSNRAGVVVMADGDCTDMSGCIEVFTSIDAQVKHIETRDGDGVDTVYRVIGNKWVAF